MTSITNEERRKRHDEIMEVVVGWICWAVFIWFFVAYRDQIGAAGRDALQYFGVLHLLH